MAPPPPGPPPPPLMPSSQVMPAASGHQRDMLLQSIRKGTKLKKTVTVDKSGPFVSGKIAEVSNNGVKDSSLEEALSNGSKMQQNINGTLPSLGSLFAGGMPKLKPTGLIGSSSNSTKEGVSIRSLSTESKSRGPPPQPPPANYKPQISSSASDSVLASTYPTNNISCRPANAPLVAPSKPPAGGYGKPNVAPKPPVSKEVPSHLQANTSDSGNSIDHVKPSPPPKKISLNGRPGVNRAQSMRVPKSPPVAPTTSPPFPPVHKQNLVKNQRTLFQSQEALSSRNFMVSKTGTLPHSFQKMTLYPPNSPPPPAPIQRTPARAPVSRPPPPPSRPAPPPAPPPPPPHRAYPAPPPPCQSKLQSMVTCSVPPAPPVRNLSVRNGSFSGQNEMENKFGHLFHNVQEFPSPGAYRNLIKNYNTRATAIAKQPAPPPPVPLGSKMWISSNSHC